jgi:hypothetical protein
LQEPGDEVTGAGFLRTDFLKQGKASFDLLEANPNALLDRGNIAGDLGPQRVELLRQVVDAVLALVGIAIDAFDLAAQPTNGLADLVKLTSAGEPLRAPQRKRGRVPESERGHACAAQTLKRYGPTPTVDPVGL